MRVTIHDEATRRVLESAIWLRIRRIVDPGDMTPLGSQISDMEEAALGYANRNRPDYGDLLSEVDAVIGVLTALRAQIAEVKAAEVGDHVYLTMSADALREGVESAKDGIEEYDPGHFDGGLLAQAPDVRERLIASVDAARRLLDELPKPAEAVA